MDPISILDRGAESNIKTSAFKHYAKAGAEFYTEGTVDPISIYKGITDAHSYDNFDTNKVSHQAYHHQPTF
jgi:hypothetical protein